MIIAVVQIPMLRRPRVAAEAWSTPAWSTPAWLETATTSCGARPVVTHHQTYVTVDTVASETTVRND